MNGVRAAYRGESICTLQRAAAPDAPQSRTVVASTARKDRMGRIVEQKWDLDSFRANPVLLANHDQSRFPIGTADVYMGRHNRQDALFADLAFDTEQALGRTAADLWDRGFLRAVSVGWTAVAEPFLRFDAEGIVEAIVFPENELAELSVVSVPANPDALAVASVLDLERGQLASLLHDLPAEGIPTAPPASGRAGASRVGRGLPLHQARLRMERARLGRVAR